MDYSALCPFLSLSCFVERTGRAVKGFAPVLHSVPRPPDGNPRPRVMKEPRASGPLALSFPSPVCPNTTQFVRAGGGLDRLAHGTQHFHVGQLVDFRHELQSLGAELEFDAEGN